MDIKDVPVRVFQCHFETAHLLVDILVERFDRQAFLFVVNRGLFELLRRF